jgi:hypothetical protein
MKVKIGPYKNWFGPYQLAEKLMFWFPKEKDEWGFTHTAKRVHNFGEWLASGKVTPEPEVGDISSSHEDEHETLLYKFLKWVDTKKKRQIDVRIDRWDTWSMDDTLAHIILPMLKQLKETKHGSPHVDLEDVPEEMRVVSHEEWDDQKCFEFYNESEVISKHDIHSRWDWVIDEMIFAFECKAGKHVDWEDQFHTGNPNLSWVKLEDGNYQMVKGENDTSHWDKEGHMEFHDRIRNGFRLFGKYYESLWD